MACTPSEENSSEPAENLVSLIENGATVSQEVLQTYADKGELDARDKDGRTTLMMASLKGLQDTVKFLLANGADPNSKSAEGNSPMHYACMVEESETEDSLGGRFYRPSKWMESKLAIAKLLLSSGAAILQDNLDGWSALYVAALYRMKDLVDFFVSMDNTPLEVKIKAFEIQGVSEATLSGPRTFSTTTESYHSFSRAISLQQELTIKEVQKETSDLAMCFAKGSLKECHTQEELDDIKQSTVGLQTHAYLLGERHFTDNLKKKYLYPSLAYFGSALLFEHNMFEEGFQVLQCAICFEDQDRLELGSVITKLAEKSALFVFEKKEPNLHYRQCLIDLLHQYEPVFQHTDIAILTKNIDTIMDSFGEVLFNEAFYCSNTHVEILKSTLDIVRKSVKTIRSTIRKEDPDMYPKIPSVTFKTMELLGEAYVDNMYSEIPDESLLRVKFVLLKLLFSEDASYKDGSDSNLLHLVTYCTSVARDYNHLMDLTRAFVRHGCPLDVVNQDGDTPRSILEEEEVYDHDSEPSFLRLVCPPTSALRLEELSIRTILKHDVNYQDVLPQALCVIMEDDITDLISRSEEVGQDDKE